MAIFRFLCFLSLLMVICTKGLRRGNWKCTLDPDFKCSKKNIKRCGKLLGVDYVKMFCKTTKTNNSQKKLMNNLRHAFAEVMIRKPRYVTPLPEDQQRTPSLNPVTFCDVGGGTITTYDGHVHIITGYPCDYVLSLDGNNEKFSVIATFDSHKDGEYANKLVNVALYSPVDNETALVLGRGFEINYNGEGVKLPVSIADTIDVWNDTIYIYVEVKSTGLLLRWNPEGHLQIGLEQGYFKNTLGLCGIYDGDSSIPAEHNSYNSDHDSEILYDEHYFTSIWALRDCPHVSKAEHEIKVKECQQAHDMYSDLCTMALAAPQLTQCLGPANVASKFHKECVQSLCLCNDVYECLYSEVMRLATDCERRFEFDVSYDQLKKYLNNDFIKVLMPSYSNENGDMLGESGVPGEPYSYRMFKPGAHCYIYGHSYIQTFDEVTYRTGAVGCTYPLALGKDLKEFAVYGTFVPQSPGEHVAASLSYVTFIDIRNKIRVQLGRGMDINYEGSEVILPHNTGRLSLWYNGIEKVIYLYAKDAGVLLRWDGNSILRVSVNGKYLNELKGLCGTYSESKDDEINSLQESPLIAPNLQLMVKTWVVGGCSHNPDLFYEEDTCTPNSLDEYTCTAALSRMELSLCAIDLPLIHFINRCKEDLCRCQDDDECKCTIVSAYAQICQDKLGTQLDWRSDAFCPLNLCVYNYNKCQHQCHAPGFCSCDDGFELASDGRSCLIKLDNNATSSLLF